jgi:stress-induced morphogen
MPCKIEIRKNITRDVIDHSDHALRMSLEDANQVASKINNSYGVRVVSFGMEGEDVVARHINIPSTLVDVYYNHELKLEAKNQEIIDQSAEDLQQSEIERGTLAEEDRNEYYQIKQEQYHEGLRETLLKFLKGINITVDDHATDLLSSLKFKDTPTAAFDVLQKFLALKDDITDPDLALQVSNVIYTFLGKKSKLAKDLWFNVNKWSKYKEVYDRFSGVHEEVSEDTDYKDERVNNFAHKQAIIHLIAESILNNYGKTIDVKSQDNPDIDKTYFENLGYRDKYEVNVLKNLLNGVWNWINKNILQNKPFREVDEQGLKDTILDIVDDVFKQDYKKFVRNTFMKDGKLYKQDGKELELKDYDETLNKDSFAKEIITTLVEHPFMGYKLSGSQTLRKYGKVFRPIDEDLHDIDGVITLDQFRKEQNSQEFLRWLRTRGLFLQKNNKRKEFTKGVEKFLSEEAWYKNLKILFPSWKLDVAFIGKDHKNAESVTITGSIAHPTEIDPKTGKNKLYVMDFFLRTDEGFYPEIFDNYWKDWKQIFEAKLNMGRSKDLEDLIYFDPFIQDKYKFTNKGFRYFTFASNAEFGNNQNQLTDMSMSAASEETLNKVKEAAKKMGINIENLADYAKKTGLDIKSINGVADLIKGIVAIAQGVENIALTEEMVHIATAILEQTNPAFITQLISKIDKFKIYDITRKAYAGNKNYQLSNGKPDIRKIKKEAVDKLIAELIIFQSEGSTEYPELREEKNQSIIKQWWNWILGYIREVYRKTNISIFEEAAQKVMAADYGTISDIKRKDTFYQIKNDKVDALYDTVIDRDSRIEGPIPATDTDKRHYLFDGKRVAKSVTEKVKAFLKMPTRTPAQQIIDDQKKEWGSEGHAFIYKYITTNLIDKLGYRLDVPLNIRIDNAFTEEIEKALINFSKELINSYKDGTRFLLERKVVNEKVKGLIASAIDFMAIEPNEETGMKVDILDWKFTSIDKTREDDIPWFKQKEWIPQMGEYSKMLYNYGVKPNQLRKTRMIPFINNYSYSVPGDTKSALVPTSVEVGKINSLTETNLYLLPVALPTESTGNSKIDKLLESLRQQHKKLFSKPVSPEDKFQKNIELAALSAAIRSLHLRLDFKPLISVGKTFLDNAKVVISSFENIDYSKLTVKEIQDKLTNLIEYGKSAEKYTKLDDIFLSHFPKEGLTKEDLDILVSLDRLSSATERMVHKIETIQTEYVIQLALSRGINLDVVVTPEGERKIQAEATISGFVRTFEEASKLPAKLINLATNLIVNSHNLVDLIYAEKMKAYEKIIIPLEKEARAKGVKAFNMIGNISTTGLNLIRKIDKVFWNELQDARTKHDKKFFLSNLDIVEYNKLSKDIIDKGIELLNRQNFSSDEKTNEEKKSAAITRLKNSIDINRDTFNGYEGFQFGRLINQTLIEEGHLSEEYLNMSKSENALRVWEFFTELNQKGKQLGYLEKEGTSFFPLIEATTLHKFNQTQNYGAQLKDFFTDLYSVRINEENAYSKIDPETQKKRKQIPKYFTKTDKKVEQLSTDLNQVGGLWLKALLDYENSKSMEGTLQTILIVEKAKGSLILDEQGDVMFDGAVVRVDESVNKNANILEAIVDDHLYNLQEDANSIGNLSLSSVTGKLKKDKESIEKTEVSIKKGIKNADVLVRVLGVGLKPLIGLSNWAGFQLHAFITSGSFYTFSEFEKNNAKITTNLGISTIERGLLNLIVPLTENITTEMRRRMAKSQGFLEYLSTWTFSDVMMVTSSFPERKLQFANAMSFNQNSMVVNGKIVNIRQYVKKQDRQEKYKKNEDGSYVLNETERSALDKTYEERVNQLKETSSLVKIAKIENDEVIIPGVSTEALSEYRTKIIEHTRTLNGQMTEGNKAGYRRDTILTSFMMFKTWIPKLTSGRISGIQKNIELDEWQYGRARVFIKTWAHLGTKNIMKMRDIILGTDEGLKILNDMLEIKRQEYFKKTGQTLEISEEEFYDLMKNELTRELKELETLFLLMGVIIATKVAAPPDDSTDLEKNRFKYFSKGINKIVDEIAFYYNPTSMETITRGTVLPALGLLTKIEKIIESLSKEVIGYAINDEDMVKKAYPMKYFLNIIPGAAQFNSEVLPYIAPELAKEMGIRVTSQSRRQ